MADKSFDPYHKWLGIPPEEQPPNHYELLGLRLFETDADVIDAAANRQMMFIKQFGTGPHSESSQQLLNELSASRLILLNPEKKKAYDTRLRKKKQTAESSTPSPPPAPAIDIKADPNQSIVEKSKQKSQKSTLMIAAAAIVLLVGFGLFKVLQKPAEETPPDQSVAAITNDQPENDPTTPTNEGSGTSENMASGESGLPSTSTSPTYPNTSPTNPTPDQLNSDTTVASTNTKSTTDPNPTVTTASNPPKPGSKPYLQFQGQSYVELANTAGLLDLNGSFTIEMWVKIPPAPSNQVQFIAGDEAWTGMNPNVTVEGTCGWVLRKREGKLEFSMGSGGKSWYSPSGTFPDSDEWQYIRIEKTGTSVGGFANGETVFSSNSRERKFVPSPTNIFLGVRKFSYRDRSSNVAIRAFRLTASTPYRGNYTVPKSFETVADTAALLDFSKGTGTQLADLTGNGHNGTIVGAQWKYEETSESAVAQSYGQPVDLLKTIDVTRDAVKGDFTLENGSLSWPGNNTRLQIPADVPAEYDLIVTASHTAGNVNGLIIGLMVDGHQTMAIIDHSGSGLQHLDGKYFDTNETFNKERGLFKSNNESTVVCSVRKTGVKVTFDDKTLIDWKGDLSRLSLLPAWQVPNKEALVLGGWSGYTISRLELRPLSESVDQTPKKTTTPIDLLTKIDTNRDTVAGKFSLENGRLISQSQGVKNPARLQIPLDVPSEYEFIITSTRISGYGFGIGFLVDGHQIQAYIDGDRGSGLQQIDGNNYHSNETSNKERGLFQTGKESTIVCSVRKSSVKITFDGKTLIDWKGDPTRFLIHEGWAVPNKQALFIGSSGTFSISRLELRPLSASKTPKKTTTPIDLLAKIDLERDAVAGKFSFENSRLTSQSQEVINPARLQIPLDVPSEYDFTITSSRTSGYGLGIGLLVDGHQILAYLDGDRGSGLQQLDGNNYHSNETSNKERGLFQGGKDSTIVCSVRKSSVKITFDGKTLIDWKGDPTRFMIHEVWAVPNTKSLFIGGLGVHTISRLELRPVGTSALSSRSTEVLANRKPIPDVVDQKKAMALVKDLFKDEYAVAKKPEQKYELAKKLLQQGINTKTDPVSKYVLLQEARDLAADSGMAETALAAVDELVLDYQLDLWEAREEALSDTAKYARFPAQNKLLVDVASNLINDAVAEDRYELAVKLANMAVSAARKVRDKNLSSQTFKLRTEVTALKKDFDVAMKAAETLKETPDDPAANFAWGSYLCLNKNDWSAGLPLLAKSSDAKLQKVIESDLASPTTAEAQLELADAWWDWIDSSKKKENQRFRIAAHYWYKKAVGSLDGLVKLKVEKRLKEIGDVTHPRTETASTTKTSPLKTTAIVPSPPSSPAEVAALNRKAAEWVLELGGQLRLSVNGTDVNVQGTTTLPPEPFFIRHIILTNNKEVTDNDLSRLQACLGLEVLYLRQTNVTDACLVHLKQLTKLDRLYLGQTKVTDEGLKTISGMTSLSFLELECKKITDDGLKHLNSLSKLNNLKLRFTQVTGSGLKDLSDLKNLRDLQLASTPIDDAGLEYLKLLKNLQVVNLRSTKVTAAGVANLQKALPNCTILH